MMDDGQNGDICRVCRSEGSPDRPLFHPCICTGSIKFIHQECLVQWMRYSRKEYCELCGYRFSFTPIYSPDMPRRLPIRDIVSGLVGSIMTAVKYWFHYTLVAVAWLGVVPLTACRVYRCLFSGSVDSVLIYLFNCQVLTLPLDMFSTENIWPDIFHGCFVVSCTLFAFIGLVWLREQILHGGGPDWLEAQPPPPAQQQQPQQGVVIPPVPVQPPQDVPPQQGDPVPPAAEPAQAVPLVPPPGGDQDPPQHQDNNIQDNLNNNLQDNLPPVIQPQGVVEEANGGGGEWNPLEWDRAAEELTWERLLGLDGSLVFLEHVFWVVSLNTLFILIFAYCPYHMGHFTVSTLGFKHHVSASHFQGLVTTLCGYCVIGVCLVSLHSLAALLSLVKSRRILGHCYVVVKVSLLSVVEIGVLPLVCGWWLDVCSLSLFDATLRDRQASFRSAPGTSMFIHWLVGMVYVYYFASFVLLLREVLRPGVLWFLRNLNEPDFSPIQEMIHLPIVAHVRRLLASAVIFGSAVLLMLWLPIRIIRYTLPDFLPYTVALHSESQVNELSLELLLLQVILPALLEQSQTRAWLKVLVRWWCIVVSYILDIKSYLLGDQNTGPVEPAPAPADGGGGGARELGAAHHAMLLNRAGPTGFEPYTVPKWFACRLVALMMAMCGTLVCASVIAFTVPVSLGRWFMSVYPGKPQHELYTVASGTYMCWLLIRCITLVISWVPRGRQALIDTVSSWSLLLLKSVVALFLLVGVIPLMSGLLLELVLVVPLRVPLDQTPVLWLWQDWALGVLYTKIVCALTMMGPDWSLRQAIERVYRDGIRGMQLTFIIRRLALPVIGFLALALSLPYIAAHSIAPLFVTSPFLKVLIARRIYPSFLLLHITAFVIAFQLRQFARLYEHIKNDKYLIGRRLVNYHHKQANVHAASA